MLMHFVFVLLFFIYLFFDAITKGVKQFDKQLNHAGEWFGWVHGWFHHLICPAQTVGGSGGATANLISINPGEKADSPANISTPQQITSKNTSQQVDQYFRLEGKYVFFSPLKET